MSGAICLLHPFLGKNVGTLELNSPTAHSWDIGNDAHLLTKASVHPQSRTKPVPPPRLALLGEPELFEVTPCQASHVSASCQVPL